MLLKMVDVFCRLGSWIRQCMRTKLQTGFQARNCRCTISCPNFRQVIVQVQNDKQTLEHEIAALHVGKLIFGL